MYPAAPPTAPILSYSACFHSPGGNNENEASFGWFLETLSNPPLYAVDFSRLFAGVVRQVRQRGTHGSQAR